MKILLYGLYGHGNLGDDLIMEAVTNYLKKKNVHWDLVYSGNDFYFGVPYQIYGDTFTHSGYFLSRIIHKIAPKKNIEELVKKYDKIIFIGGGYLNDIFDDPIYDTKRIVCAAKKNNIKVYFTGQSTTPLSGVNRESVLECFRYSSSVLVREKYSYENLLQSDIECKLSGDDVSLLSSSVKNCKKDNYFIFCLKDFGENMLFFEQILSTLEQISIKTKLTLVIVPFRNRKKCQENIMNYKMLNILRKKISCKIRYEHNICDLFNVFSSAQFVLSMAYHGSVLSIISKTKSIGIYNGDYYNNKIKGIYQLNGLNDCLELKDFTCDNILELLSKKCDFSKVDEVNLRVVHYWEEILND